MSDPGESTIWNVSLRGLMALIVVVTLCVLVVIGREVGEPFKTIAVMVVSFYFWQGKRSEP